MTTGVFSAPVTKEIRALAPTWAAALAVVGLASYGGSRMLVPIGLIGCAFGAIALGAQSIGHEYSHRTVTLLLSQPVDRRRLLLYKASVLLVMVGSLVAFTIWAFAEPLRHAPGPDMGAAMLVLIATCGLSIAPWLTMVCRSPLAGGVFAIAIPGLLRAGLDVLGGAVYGLEAAASIDRFTSAVFFPLMYLACIGAAAALWRTFIRLEAIEGGHAEIQLPGAQARGSLATDGMRRQPVLRALVAKELRLQQMAYLAAAIFTVLWVGFAWREHLQPRGFPFVPLALLYGGILALLVGSMTSAQERELGTLEWQTLQPVPGWQQWAVKTAVAVTLSLTFGVALPMVLSVVTGTNARFAGRQPAAPWVAVSTLGLTAVGIYLSTLCRTSVTALVLSVPTVVALTSFFRSVGYYLPMSGVPEFGNPRATPFGAGTVEALSFAAMFGLTALLIGLAHGNHHHTDGPTRRLMLQIPLIAGYVVVAAVALVLAG